ncbi:MAG: serine hydrolase [Candidatus Gastranaerophilales bacterium]|nr:serine hydrolase [Candidatus Gastranaerophilales bacterium]
MSNPLKKQTYKNYQGIYEYNHSYYDFAQEANPKRKRVPSKKKNKNIFKKFITTFFALMLLSTYGYFICTYNFKNYFEPLYLNRILNYKINLKTKEFAFPTNNYLHNSYFLGEYLLTPRATKTKTISDIQIISEMTNTKNKLLELAKNYSKLEPSIFVWEYSTGSGLEINSDKIFPSASIIKVPIAFELIRLIDKTSNSINPISLTDKRVFRDEYRTLGSGDLQYTKSDVTYSLDYLANIMIANSDNSATNMLLYEIGGIDSFNREMRNLGLNAISMGEWLPDLDGNNKITAREISKILYNIDNPNYINPKYKNILKEYLGNTKNTHLIKEKLPKDVMVLHKTGDIGTMLGDSGIVYTDNGKKYIVTILTKRPHNDYGAKVFIQEASLLIYNDIKALL